jgi:hypothetical protein
MYHLDSKLVFLQEKIKDIKIALFKSDANSELQLPNNIIETLKVEENGYIWFFTSCTLDQAKNIDKSFYAYLDYYKKGIDCSIKLSGQATIIEDDNGDFLAISNYSKSTASRLLLVKMKILQAEYFENKNAVNATWKGKIFGVFNSLFFQEVNKSFNFN